MNNNCKQKLLCQGIQKVMMKHKMKIWIFRKLILINNYKIELIEYFLRNKIYSQLN